MYLEIFMTFRVEIRSYPVRHELLIRLFYSFGMGIRCQPISVASNVIACYTTPRTALSRLGCPHAVALCGLLPSH